MTRPIKFVSAITDKSTRKPLGGPMVMKIGSLFGMLVLALVSCTSTGPVVSVVERADNLSRRPEWVKDTEPAFEKDGRKYFVGFVEVPGTSSKSAAMNMADEKAMSEPMKALVSDFLDQNGVGEDLTDSTGRRVISSLRNFRPPMPSLNIKHRYYEVISTKADEISTPMLTLRAYSLAEIPAGEFQVAQQKVMDKLRGEPEIKKILDDVGAKQRDRVLGSDGK